MRAGAIAILLICARSLFADTAAVLPFYNASGTRGLDWVGEGIAETVRETLGARGVLALDRNDVREAFRRLGLPERALLSEASVIKVGEAMDAEHVVFGRFTVSPAPAGSDSKGSLRIAARVIDRRHLRQSPEFEETGALEDLAIVEAHLTWRALQIVGPNLAPPESEFRGLRVPYRLDAQENYVRGLLAAPDQQERYFLQAARLDARFTHPAFQLGRIYYQRKEYRRAAEYLEKVAAEDIHWREAQFFLGLARFEASDYPAAEKAFATIAAAVPLPEVINNQAAAESRRNLPAAIDNFRRALEGDPNDPLYQFNTGYALWKRGEFGGAADLFRAVLDRTPEDQLATLLLGRCLKKQGPGRGSGGDDARLASLERLKTNFEERAYWQLKAALEGKTP
jgi:tetratricopeptide (TPR) repeat protein